MANLFLPGYPEARTSIVLFRQKRSLLKLVGKDVMDFLHRMSTNDLLDLPDGGNRRTVLVNEKGRIVDLVNIVRSGDSVRLIGSRGNGPGLAQWLERFIIMEDVRIAECQDTGEALSLIGPGSLSAVSERERLSATAIAIREDLGTIPAFLLLGEANLTGLPTMGDPAFETIRVEEGVPAYGRELTPEYNPLEAGLKDCISFSKGCYIGQEVIARLNTYKKLQKILSVFEFPWHSGTSLSPGKLLHQGVDAGTVTSTVYSPAHQVWIGLGYRRLKTDTGNLVLQPGNGGGDVTARCVSELPESYESYEITAE